MEVAQGTVARSKAGRDKDRFFVVLQVSGDFALVADGALRKLAKPKRKRLRHLAPTGRLVDVSDIRGDKQLRELLSSYNQKPLAACDTGGNRLVKE